MRVDSDFLSKNDKMWPFCAEQTWGKAWASGWASHGQTGASHGILRASWFLGSAPALFFVGRRSTLNRAKCFNYNIREANLRRGAVLGRMLRLVLKFDQGGGCGVDVGLRLLLCCVLFDRFF